MKLDKKPDHDLPPVRNMFTKVGEIKEPDSPPPEKNVSAEDEGGMSKFDHLMKAAVSIKSA
jgi:hypothetical protein